MGLRAELQRDARSHSETRSSLRPRYAKAPRPQYSRSLAASPGARNQALAATLRGLGDKCLCKESLMFKKMAIATLAAALIALAPTAASARFGGGGFHGGFGGGGFRGGFAGGGFRGAGVGWRGGGVAWRGGGWRGGGWRGGGWGWGGPAIAAGIGLGIASAAAMR